MSDGPSSGSELGNSQRTEIDLIDISDDPQETLAPSVLKRQIPDLSKCRALAYQLYDWSHEDRFWKCKLCTAKFQHHKTGGSSTLNKHAQQKHNPEFSKLKPATDSKQLTLGPHLTKRKPAPPPVTKDGVQELLLKYIVETDQAFNHTEQESFQDLITYVSRDDDNATLPGRTTVRTKLTDMYKVERDSLKKELSINDGKISLIVDCWTSSNNHAFQIVIATWIDNDWNSQTSILDLTVLDNAHTGHNLGEALANVITEFGLWQKIMSITTDNATNCNTMLAFIDGQAVSNLSDFQSENFRVRCLLHIVNLACKEVIKSVEKASTSTVQFKEKQDQYYDGPGVISKIRCAVHAVRGSSQRQRQFDKVCDNLGVPRRQLIPDVTTRWNSTLDMLVRLKDMRAPFEKAVILNQDLQKYKLTEPEWKYVDELIGILTPFKEITLELSKGSPNLSETTAVYQILFAHLEKYIDNEAEPMPSTSKRPRRIDSSSSAPSYPEWAIDAAREGWEKLKDYYPSSDTLIHVAATALDPRMKLVWHKAIDWEASWQQKAKKDLVVFWENHYKMHNRELSQGASETSATDSQGSGSHVPDGDIFTELLDDKMKKFHKSDDELKQYLAEPPIPPKSCPEGMLHWWKMNAPRLPRLSQMAKDVYSVHGTGVSVERLFSSGPDLLKVRRQSMSAVTIKEAICLKYWLKRKRSKGIKEFEADIRVSKLLGADYDAVIDSA